MLSHPNIATVYDVEEIDGRPYLAMELLEGRTLADILAESGRLPIREVVEIGIHLGRALDYAHARGIVHRDIKPANIIRLQDSSTIKVTDFRHRPRGGRGRHPADPRRRPPGRRSPGWRGWACS